MTVYGGIHPTTASLMQVLAMQGVKNPATSEPFTEAMLLGIGGGLGAGYILWEFKRHDSPGLVLGFRNRWNYMPEFLQNIGQRIGAKTVIQESTSRKKAADNLQAGMAAGQPFIAWVDKAYLPYHDLPESLKGYVQYQVVILGADKDTVRLADVFDTPQEVPAEIFADGREKIPSDKNRLMFVTPPEQIDLPAAIKAGIADELEHLGSTSETFSLPVFQKWAKMMTHAKDKKGWPTVFRARSGLYTALRKIHEAITLDGTEGAALRSMYADFLRQASPVLNNAALCDAADAYSQAAKAWQTFADTVLMDSVPEFAETKTLLQTRYAALRANRINEVQQTGAKLADMLSRLNGTNFPLDDAATKALFERMADNLNAIFQAEVNALNTLRQASQ